VPFLAIESDWKASSLPRHIIPPNTYNKNFGIAILSSVVDFQRENMFLRRILPQSP
jgi:hypothetical protein